MNNNERQTSTKRGHYKKRICPVCKKEFKPEPLHAYKIKKDKLVCSYKCECEYEKRVRRYGRV